jgi:hypothetical protein
VLNVARCDAATTGPFEVFKDFGECRVFEPSRYDDVAGSERLLDPKLAKNVS